MKFDGVGASTALFRDFLALPDRLTLGDQQPVVVTVSGEVGVIVLDDDQFTKTYDAVARVHDLAVGHSHDRIAALPADLAGHDDAWKLTTFASSVFTGLQTGYFRRA